MKLHMCLYLRTKFEVCSTILTSFRQGWGWGEVGDIFNPTTSKRTPKNPTQIKVKRIISQEKGNKK